MRDEQPSAKEPSDALSGKLTHATPDCAATSKDGLVVARAFAQEFINLPLEHKKQRGEHILDGKPLHQLHALARSPLEKDRALFRLVEAYLPKFTQYDLEDALAKLDGKADPGRPKKARRAKRLEGRSHSGLDESATELLPHWVTAPWAEPVRGRDVLDEVVAVLSRFVVLPENAANAIALWLAFAHTFDAFTIAPILAIESPEKRCGKTTLLELIELLAPRGYMTANASTAAVFRITDQFHPTLIADEAETFLTTEKSELIGIINAGHRRRSVFVDRVEGDGAKKRSVRRFSAWSPKAVGLIGSIGDIRDTLQDRSIRVRMRRKRVGEKVERLRHDRVEDFLNVNRKLCRWAADNIDKLRAADPPMPDALNDRAQDNWRPLTAIADLAGNGWPSRVREIAVALSTGDDDDDSGAVLLLKHCREIFERLESTALAPSDLVAHLSHDAEWPWATWRGGRDPITPRGVAKLLKPFGIRSSKSGSRRYLRVHFEEAWRHYC